MNTLLNRLPTVMLLGAGLLLVGCVDDSAKDDVVTDTADTSTDTAADTGDTTDTNDTSAGDASLTAGTWVSAGDDVSDLLAYFDVARVEAVFNGDGSYDVVSTDTQGTETTLTGTWTASAATTPGTITLNQATPSTATAEGIWQIEGRTLTYEVVQTSPAVGCSPATPADGFGSTRCSPPLTRNANVQTFQLQ